MSAPSAPAPGGAGARATRRVGPALVVVGLALAHRLLAGWLLEHDAVEAAARGALVEPAAVSALIVLRLVLFGVVPSWLAWRLARWLAPC